MKITRKQLDEIIRKKVLVEGLVDRFINYVTKTVETNRIKIVKKQIEKENPELADAITNLEKSYDILKDEISDVVENEPEKYDQYQKYLKDLANL